MYVQRCNSKKLFADYRCSPKQSFLSPANKFGQRSLSASSLSSHLPATPISNSKPLPGSLREQIRLDAFKKTLADSKLNKTAMHRATLKVQQQRSMFRPDPRCQIRELQRQASMLRQQNNQLKSQRHSDMLLISKQNQLLSRLQRQITELKATPTYQQPQCQCYLIQQYLDTIRGLELKISHLEEEEKKYKIQIREMVVKQEEMKRSLELKERERKREERERKELREIKYREGRQMEAREKEARERDKRQRQILEWEERQRQARQKQIRQRQARLCQSRQFRKQRSKAKNGQGVMRYMQYLKNIRHREIDQIDNILNE